MRRGAPLPTGEAIRVALGTQQVIAHVPVSPTRWTRSATLWIENSPKAVEAAAYDYFARIDELGGMVAAIESNFPQREIADAAFGTRPRSTARSGSWWG